MRLYYEIAIRSFRRATIYRSAYVAGILTNAFFGVLFSSMYRALYEGRESIAGLTLHDAISYVWLSQALIAIGAGWISWHMELERGIRTGDIVADLARPWNFYAFWLSRVLGERLFNLLVRGSLTYLIGILSFDALIPSIEALAAFTIAVLLSILISAALNFLVNITAFWLIDITGLVLVTNLTMGFFSGFLLPLAFFPPALAVIAQALPFQAITSIPVRTLLGQVRGADLALALTTQVCWAMALTGAALLALRAAMRKIVLQGG
ncbi:MAG: ABC transporter permease [Roseiflexus castenholzii]|uniref:ABC transporter permease n=1 Tax=Roseiflexus castenholzii TaxID=120962 RepID=UPI000CB7BD3A|nr:MAG: ABC transporter permease [Roseiflexus castenholzii]